MPSVSPERVKLWSYGNLMALRTIYWLRQTERQLAQNLRHAVAA